jgi:hypothetical protein
MIAAPESAWSSEKMSGQAIHGFSFSDDVFPVDDMYHGHLDASFGFSEATLHAPRGARVRGEEEHLVPPPSFRGTIVSAISMDSPFSPEEQDAQVDDNGLLRPANTSSEDVLVSPLATEGEPQEFTNSSPVIKDWPQRLAKT